jgi:hypothetical protein
MKTLLNILIIAALATTSAFADAKVKAGPRKGLILELGGKKPSSSSRKTAASASPSMTPR